MLKYQKRNCFVLSLPIFMAFIAIVTIAAVAQTPDGMTPGDEDSCRGVYGSAFGLCNAFCEAQDCDSFNPMDWKNSCFKLLANYGKKTGDPGPPCFCGGACSLEHEDCIAECDPTDPCCEIDCNNARAICNNDCCNQNEEIKFNICIENCNGDPDCEITCPKGSCDVGIIGCLFE